MRANPFIFVILLSCLAFSAEMALAQEAEENNGVEFVLGLGYRSAPDEEAFVTNYGLRYHHRFNGRWGFEVTGEVQDDFAVRDEEGLFFDISARLTLFKNDRLEFFTFFGPGIVFFDRRGDIGPGGDSPPLSLVGDESFTLHAGLGLDIGLIGRSYLRPDLRFRHYDGAVGSLDNDNFESTIALGFRF